MKSLQTFLITIFFSFLFLECYSITLSTNGKTNYQIIIPAKATANEKHAADVLSKYLKKVTGADFLVYDDKHARTDYEILIGINSHLNAPAPALVNHPDGFSIETRRNNLLINGGGGNGVVYAIYTFLEKFCGCRKYSADGTVVPKIPTLEIPDLISITEIPKIDFREYYYTATVDDEYREWHKLMQHSLDTVSSQWGMWVHTANKLVPSEKYFDSHPEYYSYYGGKRQPTQLCWSNIEVYDTLVKNLRAEMKKKPNAKYWSVSQNDNYGYCTCDKCRAIDSVESSPSGSLIRFVNKVAAEFPGKIISTLAYQYSRSAPKITKPAKNVNIMFCSIECNRSRPIAEDSSSASFRKDFEDWSKLTHNILVWDYVVQFANYVSPFPNFKVLQPNLQYFSNHGVRDMFEQGSSSNWSDFGEMKAYIISALLWDTDVNVDSLMQEFTKGYYGAAGEDLLNYYYTLQENLNNSGDWLDIYGNPVTPHNSWLSIENMVDYNEFIEGAKANVYGDSVFMKRVERAALPFIYAQLEQAKFYGTGENGIFEKDENGKWNVKEEIIEKVNEFVTELKSQKIKTLNENNLSPDTYYDNWQHIFSHGMIEHFAMDKPVTFEIPFSPKYPAKGVNTLTDGIGGYDDYHYNWLGWEGEDMIATVDLGETKNVSSISCDFMEDQKSWIFFPSNVEYFYSADGRKFLPMGSIKSDEPKANKNANIKSFSIQSKTFYPARYVKVVAHNLNTCPRWHIGAGYPCWIFCDEIVVR
ncbi:MAG: DUF4838 domain-containing protein [Bacteroidia bacterium]